MSVNGIIKKYRTEAFDKNMDIAVATIKRMLSSNEELTIDNLRQNLDYSNSDYEYAITAYEGGNFVIIKSTNTGKFKNIDFDTINKNPNYTYIKGDDINQIIAKIDNNGVVGKSDSIDEDTVNYITGKYPETCTYSPKKSTYEIGDVISFCNYETGKSEDFYVINDDGNKVAALAKYYLFAGLTRAGYRIPESANGYCLQKDYEVYSEQFAEKDSNNMFYGDYIAYWAKGIKLLEKYGTNYPAYVYDENSSLYKYIEKYKDYFIDTLKKKNVNMRLITYGELVNLGCSEKDATCATEEVKKNGREWIYEHFSSYYWTGSAKNNYRIWGVTGAGTRNGKHFDSSFSALEAFLDDYYGIRPVIEINKSEI